MTPPEPDRRPRDLALLLLALGHEPPRARARDQQADLAGGDLRRTILDRLAALDPEPDALEATLARIVEELGEPTGPTRAVAALIHREWRESQAAPAYWSWLLSEAVRAGEPRAGRRRRGPESPD